MKKYFFNVLIALDQSANALTGGDPDETLSSRMGKYVANKRGFIPCFICKLLNKIDPNHCISSIEEDEGKDAVIWESKTNKENK